MDVLWFRLSKTAGDPEEPMGHFAPGRILIMISRSAQSKPLAPPLPVRIVSRLPVLQRIAARMVGVGVRPEHIGKAILGGGYNASGDK